MPYLVCDRFHTGPNCSDKRLERTPAEKEDCVKRVRMECTREVWKCREDRISEIGPRTFDAGSNSSPNREQVRPEPIDDMRCYNDTCLEALLACYCAGLAGLTCVVCGDDELNGFDPFPKPDEDEDEDEEPEETDPPVWNKITASELNAQIPMVFGRVVLPGNIIDISEPFYAPSGAGPLDPRINLLLSVCEGPVEEVLRVWVGNLLIIDKTSSTLTITDSAKEIDFKVKVYNGSEAQKVIPRPGAFQRQVAYRGQTLIEILNYPLLGSGGRLPELRVEVTTSVNREQASFEASGVTAANDTLISSPARNRLMYVEDDNVFILSEDGMNVVTTLTADANVVASTLQYTYTDDILFQDADDDVNFISRINYGDVMKVSASGAADFILAARVPTRLQKEQRVIGTVIGTELKLYRSWWFRFTPTLEETIALPVAPVFATADYFFLTDSRDEGLYVCTVGQDADSNFVFYYRTLHHVVFELDYPNNDPPATRVLEKVLAGMRSSAPVLQKVIYLAHQSAFLLFVEDEGLNKVIKVQYSQEDTILWSTTLPAPMGSNLQTQRYGDSLVFASGTKAYRLYYEDGEVEEAYNFATSTAPTPLANSTISYNSLYDTLTYIDEDGEVTKALVGRATANQITVADCVEKILTRAGVPLPFQDISAVAAVALDGFVLAEKTTAAGAFEELSAFYHLSVRESSTGISIIPISAAAALTINTDDYAVESSRQRIVNDKDNSSYVSVGYLDSARDFAPTSQYVTKDLLRGEDQYEEDENGFSYGVNVYTDATTARRSAELTLWRRLANSIAIRHSLLPRDLALEPSDFVTDSDGNVFRVSKSLLDTTFGVYVEGLLDTPENYQEAPAIIGSVTNPITQTIQGYVPNENLQVVLAFPPPTETFPPNFAYVGQINPDGNSFEPTRMEIGSPGSRATNIRVLPTKPVLTGVLVSGLDVFTSSRYATDYLNNVVIKFSQPLPAGTFESVELEDLQNSFTTNLLFVGGEMIQFCDVSVGIDNKTVTFSRLYRCRFGTERYFARHAVGEACYAYQEDSLKLVELPFTTFPGGQAFVTLNPANDTRFNVTYRQGMCRPGEPEWPVTRGSIRRAYDTNLGPQNVFNITLLLQPRAYHRAALYDTPTAFRNQQNSSNTAGQYLFVLKAEFDLETFVEAFYRDAYPRDRGFQFPPVFPSTDPYIHFCYMASTLELENREQLDGVVGETLASLTSMGIDLTNDTLYFAVMSDDPWSATGFTAIPEASRPAFFARSSTLRVNMLAKY